MLSMAEAGVVRPIHDRSQNFLFLFIPLSSLVADRAWLGLINKTKTNVLLTKDEGDERRDEDQAKQNTKDATTKNQKMRATKSRKRKKKKITAAATTLNLEQQYSVLLFLCSASLLLLSVAFAPILPSRHSSCHQAERD